MNRSTPPITDTGWRHPLFWGEPDETGQDVWVKPGNGFIIVRSTGDGGALYSIMAPDDNSRHEDRGYKCIQTRLSFEEARRWVELAP